MKHVLFQLLLCVLFACIYQVKSKSLLDINQKLTIDKKINRIEAIKLTLNEIEEYKLHYSQSNREILKIQEINILTNDYRHIVIFLSFFGIALIIIASLFIKNATKYKELKKSTPENIKHLNNQTVLL